MKEWWLNLSLREKQTFLVGSFVLSLVLLYLLVWSPLTDSVASLRNKIQHNQKMLASFTQIQRKIQQIEKNQTLKKSANADVSLLSIVQKQLNKTQLVSNLEQLRQADNDSVQINFKNVDFDKLTAWLILLSHEESIVISQVNITPNGTPGIVNAELSLNR